MEKLKSMERHRRQDKSSKAAEKWQVVMDVYTVRQAKPEEQRELTRLSVRAMMS
jgi:hypothetical protein